MSVRHTAGRRHLAAAAGASLLLAAALAGCSADDKGGPSVANPLSNDDPTETATQAPAKPQVKLTTNLPRGNKALPVSTLLEVSAENGTLDKVRFAAQSGKAVPGELSKNKSTWKAAERLEPGVRYTVTGVGSDSDGLQRKLQRSFRTQALTLDQQTYPSIAPLAGQTVGVGMPVIVRFDVPVTDRAEIEKHLSVDTQPVQRGSWHWISDYEVHWRPAQYWKPGTDVTVNADVNGVSAGNGIYGQENRRTSFHIGDSVIMRIDVARHVMRVFKNGQMLRSIPISAGQPGLETRSGVKVIIEKFRYKDMDAATTGVSENDPNYYNISNVEYAQRVTYSGEFLHAAPWSVGSQGSANVSHGCVGMSTENAAWLYGLTKVGDVVDVTGSNRPMEPDNGYGDWNISYPQYRTASALH